METRRLRQAEELRGDFDCRSEEARFKICWRLSGNSLRSESLVDGGILMGQRTLRRFLHKLGVKDGTVYRFCEDEEENPRLLTNHDALPRCVF